MKMWFRAASRDGSVYGTSRVVWDYIAVYKPEQIWTDVPPQPEFKGRPVVRFMEGTRKALETIYSETHK